MHIILAHEHHGCREKEMKCVDGDDVAYTASPHNLLNEVSLLVGKNDPSLLRVQQQQTATKTLSPPTNTRGVGETSGQLNARFCRNTAVQRRSCIYFLRVNIMGVL